MAVGRREDEGARLPLRFRPMTLRDLPEVLRIERASFPTPWSERAFVSELTQNVYADYIVARLPEGAAEGGPEPADGRSRLGGEGRPERRPAFGWPGRPPKRGEGPVVGYAGMWIVLDEAHVTNIAVAPEMRGRDIGDALLSELERRARARECRRMTLEVRPSNAVAISLYTKHGFVPRGRRPGYYSDTHEDAIVMWKDEL